jgi:hypothetical protein
VERADVDASIPGSILRSALTVVALCIGFMPPRRDHAAAATGTPVREETNA